MVLTGHYRDKYADVKEPGDFNYEFYGQGETHGRLYFLCPCGKGEATNIPFHLRDYQWSEQPNSWVWDGNKEFPTLAPSIKRGNTCVCNWHGWLCAGEWVEEKVSE